ncbi:MAG: hypothetical protein M0T79_15505 [Actinomycetota bacterium]|nr:hypothetical protein [Actinomycetota bacterium]
MINAQILQALLNLFGHGEQVRRSARRLPPMGSGCWHGTRGRKNGVRNATPWQKLLRVGQMVSEQVVLDGDDEVVIVSVRPSKG